MIAIFGDHARHKLLRIRINHKLLSSNQQWRLLPSKRFLSQEAYLNKLGPVSTSLLDNVKMGKIRHDEDQVKLSARLDRLYYELKVSDAKVPARENLSIDLFTSDYELMNHKKSKVELIPSKLKGWFYRSMQPTPPKGIYIYGHVGVGKSFLMDLFHRIALQNDIIGQRKLRRAHFHEFMLDVHDRIHKQKRRDLKKDALPTVALALAQESRILCFDEFQVTDIADAMILKRLFNMLWDAGVVVVATSNRSPDSLYEGGLNRAQFLPFIDNLKAKLDCFPMIGNFDYRRSNEHEQGDLSQKLHSYYYPSGDESTQQTLEDIFVSSGGEENKSITIPVMMGRTITAPYANTACAWFDFMELCHQPLGAADYLAICQHFPILIVDHVPQLDSSRFNEARRFVVLVDAAYESRTRLVLSSQVPLEDLLVDFRAIIETRDGDEEIAGEAIREREEKREDTFVKNEGGSSSSSATTFVKDKAGNEVEWSATGRIGVSLAQLSAVQDVSFSFRRAESRLSEMNRPCWGRAE